MYDSGQMEYDGDQGMGGMGGMNIDPNQIFKAFFGGGGGSSFGGFGGEDFGGSSFFTNMGGMGGNKGGTKFTFRFG